MKAQSIRKKKKKKKKKGKKRKTDIVEMWCRMGELSSCAMIVVELMFGFLQFFFLLSVFFLFNSKMEALL